jgi:hypothetical protein
MCFDVLNPYNLASAEQAIRRLLMIERAVRRGPRNPDFDGLDVFMANAFDSSGRVLTTAFDKHMASVKQSEAVVLKQDRRRRRDAMTRCAVRDAGAWPSCVPPSIRPAFGLHEVLEDIASRPGHVDIFPVPLLGRGSAALTSEALRFGRRGVPRLVDQCVDSLARLEASLLGSLPFRPHFVADGAPAFRALED